MNSTARQHTIAASTTISGRGLFSGAPATLTIRPAEPGQGVRFARTDLPGDPEIPAAVAYVVDRPRRTALQAGDAVVETVEHCLSALAGLGVDNARIELDAEEAPAVDGSAAPFVEAIRNAGLREQDEQRDPLVLREPIMLREGDATIAAFPNAGACMDLLFDLDYNGRGPIGRQIHAFTLDPQSYVDKIAPARTFALLEEAEAMREHGLCAHLTPRDMLVLGEAGPIDNTLRFEDEPVRHKLLDLIGDLSLVGRPVHARIVASRSGHTLNHRMARAMLEQEQAEETRQIQKPAMNIREVLRLLPHRYPMVLIDRVLEMEGDRRAVGVKNVSFNEPFFEGHFPGSPMMPGVLIVEAMGQLAGLMLSQKLERAGKIAVLTSLDRVKLRRSVTPGDQLVIEANAVRASSRFGDVEARAFVSGRLVAEARIKFVMVDADQEQP